MIENDKPHNFLVKGVDYILFIMDYTEYNDIDGMINRMDVNDIIPNLSHKDQLSFNIVHSKDIISFMHKNDYICRTHTQMNIVYYKLTELGKAVKRKGGHYKYLDFENRLETIPIKTLAWAKWAVIVGLISIAVAFKDEIKGIFKRNYHRNTHEIIKATDSTKLDIKR